MNPDGSLKWKYKTGGLINSSPAIGSDGTIYVGSDCLYAIQGESGGLADTPWPKFRKNNRNTGNYDDAE
ncbi:MAG: PQQ-binding-like beta-propeller repeat protein [Defluviitoga tunisiensis]